MSITRLVAALGAVCVFATPSAHAQEAQPATDATTVDALVTAYASGGDGGALGSTTATGTRAHWGTVAADWRVFPPGTKLRIEGFPDDVFTVEDSGGAVRGNVLDIWFPDLQGAIAFGTRRLTVTVVTSSVYAHPF